MPRAEEKRGTGAGIVLRKAPAYFAIAAGLASVLAVSARSQPKEAPDRTAPSAAASDQQMAKEFHLGAQVFMKGRCFVCHGEDGFGGAGPRFRENRFLGLGDYVVGQILIGRSIMPSFADSLSNEQIAAVATYVRNAWGNKFGPVDAGQVAAARSKMQLPSNPGGQPKLPPTARQPEGAAVPPYSPLPIGQPLPPPDLGQPNAAQAANRNEIPAVKPNGG
ncbi:MAG: c-type cytochrome [Rhizobiaceae bacterium]